MNVVWLERDALFPAVRGRLEPIDVVLDIGSGIMPQDMVHPLVHICCEPYGEYLERLREKSADCFDRTYVLVKATWEEAVRIFPEKSVDTVFLADVIEHLEKEEGARLLRATEGIARRQVAVFTPLGFLPQSCEGEDAWGLGGASWQEHRSGWLPEDFGEEWEIRASRDFHTVDHMGKPLSPPHGAFWAVRTHPRETAEGARAATLERKEKLRKVHDLSVENSPEDMEGFLLAMRGVLRGRSTRWGRRLVDAVVAMKRKDG